jgi:signal transduction histidine kinase
MTIEDQDRRSARIRRLLLVFLAFGFVTLSIGVAAAAWINGRTDYHARWLTHTYQVELAVSTARRLVEQDETTRRGYMLAPHDPVFLVAHRQTAGELEPAVDRIAALTADNPRQRVNVAHLRSELAVIHAIREFSVAEVTAGRAEQAIVAFRSELSARRMRTIRALFDAMGEEEQRLLVQRDAELRGSVTTFYLVLALTGIALALLAAATLLTMLRYTRDLDKSRNRLRQLNDTLEDEVTARTADLTRANDEIQRFAYIVSHDLRSPLVNVMGFTAELSAATAPLAALIARIEAEAPQFLSDEARLAAREDLPEAIGFIRTSTQKMDRLINAILKLSREGRRVIAPEPLDLAAIADGAVAAIRHQIDERGVVVTVERPTPAVTSDRLAVEQILSNLIENATKYLQPGRPGRIAVSAERVAGRVVIAVADNGRGIDPRDHQRVFDLFRRSGAQDQPGEGIGLAHVRALAYRLGGTIDVHSTLGEGATFRVNLPVTYQAPAKEPGA